MKQRFKRVIKGSEMKNIILLISVFLGSSLLASDIKFSIAHPNRVNKKITRSNSKPVGTVYIIIDKSDYELNVYDDKGWYATYPVVFGNNSLEDKKIVIQ